MAGLVAAQENALGYVTHANISTDTYGIAELELSIIAPVTQGTLSFLHDTMHGRRLVLGNLPHTRHVDAWRCLYCARPNALHRLDCEGCGAVRNWLLG